GSSGTSLRLEGIEQRGHARDVAIVLSLLDHRDPDAELGVVLEVDDVLHALDRGVWLRVQRQLGLGVRVGEERRFELGLDLGLARAATLLARPLTLLLALLDRGLTRGPVCGQLL